MKAPTRHHHAAAAAGMLACAALLQGVVRAAPGEDSAVADQAGDLQESITREAGRQDRVSSGIVELNRELREFIAEMETNRIYDEVEGRTLVAAAGRLDATNDDHVRNAAGNLRGAVESPETRRERIAAARGDIMGAIDQLTELMRMTETFRGHDLLAREAGGIIRSLEEVIEKSASMGREMADGTQPEARRFDELAAEQEKIAARTESLREMLRQAANDALTDTEKAMLARAAEIMTDHPADRLMRQAGKDIRESDMVSALSGQKQALEGLRELAGALEKPGEGDLAGVRKSMEKILEQQAELRERMESMDKEEMTANAGELGREQKELMDRLGELARSEPMPKAPPSNNTVAKGPDPKEPSPPTEGGAEDGGAGKKGGGSNTGAGQGSKKSPPRDRPPMEGGAPGQKPGGMGGEPQKKAQEALAQQEKAAQALAQQDQQAAAAAQREAEQALAEAIGQIPGEPADAMPPSGAESQPGEGMPGEGMPGEGMPGEGMPGEGMPGEGMPGEGKPGEGKPGAGKPGAGKPGMGPPGGSKPGQGSTGIAGRNVYGTAPDDDQSTWKSLDEEDRAGLGENFARELPREYRDMLKAYYGQLAK